MANKKKQKKKAAKRIKTQFWVIDTDTATQHSSTFIATGPYKSIRAAEAFITEDTRSTWEDSCACLTSDKKSEWCKPLYIVKLCRAVQPKIKPSIKLVDVKPME